VRRIGQELEEGCLVRDERANEIRIPCGEIERPMVPPPLLP
jgi:hypothetical protein